MSLPGQKTTATYLEWDLFLSLVAKLERDRLYKFALLIRIGTYTGLRISDLLALTWTQFDQTEYLVVREGKTGKTRNIRLNKDLIESIERLKVKIEPNDPRIFVNKYGTRTINIHYVNSTLKAIFRKYGIKVNGNVSSHLFRKTLGRRVVEQNNYSGESLILLSELFGHTSVAITRRYLGLRQEEIHSIYENL